MRKPHRSFLPALLASLFAATAAPAQGLTPAEVSALGTKYIDPSPATGSSAAVVVGDTPLAHTAQFLPLNRDRTLHGLRDAEAQARKVLEHLAAALKPAETGLPQIAKLNVCLAADEHKAAVQRVVSETFDGKAKPAITYVVGELAHPNAWVAMDAVATTSTPGSRKALHFVNDRLYGGPYATHASILPNGSRVYISGQAVRAGNLADSTRKTMEQLAATLRHLDLDWENVVQIKSFLQPMNETAKAREEITRFFNGRPAPPMVFVEWTSQTPIEIELIVAGGVPDDRAEAVEYITPPGMKASPVFCRVVRINFGKNAYISGLQGSGTTQPEAQVRSIFSDLEYLVRKTGSDMRNLVKATYYVTDAETSAQLNQLRPEFYDPARPPAASKAMVRSLGSPGGSIVVDVIAATKR